MPTLAGYLEHLLENWPAHWPRKENRVVQHDVTREQYERLDDLIKSNAGEREIEKFLCENREILSLSIWMFATGHHMSWKQKTSR
jgi:hypothetical protein